MFKTSSYSNFFYPFNAVLCDKTVIPTLFLHLRKFELLEKWKIFSKKPTCLMLTKPKPWIILERSQGRDANFKTFHQHFKEDCQNISSF